MMSFNDIEDHEKTTEMYRVTGDDRKTDKEAKDGHFWESRTDQAISKCH